MDNTLIQYITNWVSTCPYLTEINNGISIDMLEVQPQDGSINPSGQERLSEDMAGNVRWQYNGILQISGLTTEDMNRMANQGLLEQLHVWLNSFERVGIPLPPGYWFESVRAANGMMATLDNNGQFGVYQIQINLIYERMI